jgi:5'-methylthioadenosine phosphorylase
VRPGHFVIADQVVDRTRNRVDTYHDKPPVTHISLADPYDEEMRRIAVDCARELRIPFHDRGTVVVIEGPRFSTRAESRFYSAMGWAVINMTQYPEVALARELQMATVNISLITDYDVGLEDDPNVPPVSKDKVVEVFAANNVRLRDLLYAMVPRLPLSPDRAALHALDDAQF